MLATAQIIECASVRPKTGQKHIRTVMVSPGKIQGGISNIRRPGRNHLESGMLRLRLIPKRLTAST